MDLPCRYGGEEFGVILPATEAAGACIVAERIRKAVEDSVTMSGGKSLKVTCSLGLSQLAPGDDIAKLIRRADEALYKSKEAGRNCGHWNTGDKFVPITASRCSGCRGSENSTSRRPAHRAWSRCSGRQRPRSSSGPRRAPISSTCSSAGSPKVTASAFRFRSCT